VRFLFLLCDGSLCVLCSCQNTLTKLSSSLSRTGSHFVSESNGQGAWTKSNRLVHVLQGGVYVSRLSVQKNTFSLGFPFSNTACPNCLSQFFSFCLHFYYVCSLCVDCVCHVIC